MKINKIVGHWDNPAYEMNFNIRIKEEALQPTAEVMAIANLIGNPDLIPLPVVMTVIHDILVDVANKSGQKLDTILKDISDINREYPVEFGEDKIRYELR